MSDYIIGPSGELYHFGVKGMKWGRRRYQNKDGTLTAEGRRRYGDDISQRKTKDVKKQVQSGFRSGKINTQSINKKVMSEVDKTKEGKAKKNADDSLEAIFRSAEAQGFSRNRVVFDRSTAEVFNDINDRYANKLMEVATKHIDEYASTTLKSLGYKDTKAGREWLKNQGFMDW